MEIKKANISSAELGYKIFGDGKINLVIEMGLGSVIGEWQQLASRLSEHYTVLLYERAGYGSSSVSTLKRTPKNIATESKELLSKLGHEEKITILAHSQGGLYAQEFARMYPESVNKLVLLDPLSASDDIFSKELTEKEFKKSGVDKTSGLRINYRLTKLHFGWLVRKFMRQAPPFYYYNGFTKDETSYILSSLSNPKMYTTALDEYKFAHLKDDLEGLNSCDGFPNIPIVLVTHNSEIEIKEIMEFGRATRDEAAKIENLWQKIMKDYLNFSKENSYYEAKNSSHYIHLTDADLIYSIL